MKRLLYGVSPIGLGHATRAAAVAEGLRRSGVEVLFASGGNAAAYLKDLGFETSEVVEEPTPRVVGGEMKWASLWYLRYWLGYGRTKASMERLIKKLEPNLVVGDEEFAGVAVAMERGLRHALVTDELELGFARTSIARAIEAQASNWYNKLLGSVSVVLIPDFGTDEGNRRHIGPMVRRVSLTKEEVFRDHSFPEGGEMVLLSMSGSGVGSHLIERTVRAVNGLGDQRTFLAVTGNRGEPVTGERVFDLGVVRDNQNLVAAADLVVSTAGKSTIDEAASAGTPAVVIPIKNHAEQERNAAALGYKPEDIDRLQELIRDKIGRREAPRNYQGVEQATSFLASML